MNLYEMTAEIRNLYEMLAEADAEDIDQIVSDAIEGIEADKKVEGYCQVIKQLKADAEMLKAEKARIDRKKATAENAIERMRKALTDFMEASHQDKVKAGTFSVSMRETASVNILNELDLPERFLIPQMPKADKKAIKEALDNGEKVDGAELTFTKGVTIR